jgi:hypothetical protein
MISTNCILFSQCLNCRKSTFLSDKYQQEQVPEEQQRNIVKTTDLIKILATFAHNLHFNNLNLAKRLAVGGVLL